jgi:O-antigen/teichoic acid export membrane protein
MANVRSALLLTLLERYANISIQLGSSMVIARLLSPKEIGVFAIGTVFVSFAHIFRDMGVQNYLIQERELTADRIRAAQAILLTTSWLIALVLAVASTAVAAIYSEPGLETVVRVLAITFIVLPLGGITLALLRRDLRFGALFGISITSGLLQAGTSILLANRGFGFESLAWGAVAGVGSTAILATLCRRPDQPWLPGWKEGRHVFVAGSRLGAAAVFYEIGLGGPDLTTGRLLGFEAVGYLSRAFGAAYMMLRALVDVMMPVSIPYFAQQARADRDIVPQYRRGLAYLSGLAWPGFTCAFVGAEVFIRLLYGPQWQAAVVPFRILCISMAVLTLAHVCIAVTVGTGRIRLHMTTQGIFQPLKVVLAAAGAYFYGLIGAVAGIAVTDLALSFAYMNGANRALGVSWGQFANAIVRSACIGGITGAAAWSGMKLVADSSVAGAAAAIAVCSMAAWAIAVVLTGHPLVHELTRAKLWLIQRQRQRSA